MSSTLNIIQSSSDNLDSPDVRINLEFTKEWSSCNLRCQDLRRFQAAYFQTWLASAFQGYPLG